MAVGTTPIESYQGEDFPLDLTFSHPTITDISTWVIELVIKETAAEPNPALIGPLTCISTGPMTRSVLVPLDIAPGAYVYSVVRTGVNVRRQLAQAAWIVIDSASVDTP